MATGGQAIAAATLRRLLARAAFLLAVLGAPLAALTPGAQTPGARTPGAQTLGAQTPGGRALLDAHNAYPYHGQWGDRLDRALGTGTPLAIEQDLSWAVDAETGIGRSVVAHEGPFDGTEPTLADFFERIRPLVEPVLERDEPEGWPLITLNLDVKSQGDHAEHHQSILATLVRYRSWLTSARLSAAGSPTPIDWGPVLVLTGASDVQEHSFRTAAAASGELLLFGSVHDAPSEASPDAPREAGLDEDGDTDDLPRPQPATDYRRWWNHPWRVVEREGQNRAGPFSPEDAQRLRTLTARAHAAGLWLRLYTLNGAGAQGSTERGWSLGYDFGDLESVRTRWRACLEAGVDFVATDQYEDLAALRAESKDPGLQ
jgi:hypothetical protein